MSKRDFVEEILGKHSRAGDGHLGHYTARISFLDGGIKRLADNLGHDKSEWLRYVPVEICASLEGYVRGILTRLIDAGTPYIERSRGFSEAIRNRFDVDLLFAIEAAKITVGDFVSHLLPISSLSDIVAHLSILLGADWKTQLKPHFAFFPSYARPEERQAVEIEATSAQVFSDIAESFRIRHIICHESGHVETGEVRMHELCTSANRFVSAVGSLVASLIDPTYGLRTTLDVNAYLADHLRKCEELMRSAYDRLASVEVLDLPDGTGFAAVQEKWQAFCDAQATFRYQQYIDGSIKTELSLREQIALTEARTADLHRAYFDWAMGDRSHSLYPPVSNRKKR